MYNNDIVNNSKMIDHETFLILIANTDEIYILQISHKKCFVTHISMTILLNCRKIVFVTMVK